MIILVAPKLLRIFSPHINGLTLFPFILLKRQYMRNDPVLMNHEKIHIRQQAELLVIPFYLIYLAQYGFNLFYYRDHYKAYRNIMFEKEAYACEKDMRYLQRRKLFGFVRFY